MLFAIKMSFLEKRWSVTMLSVLANALGMLFIIVFGANLVDAFDNQKMLESLRIDRSLYLVDSVDSSYHGEVIPVSNGRMRLTHNEAREYVDFLVVDRDWFSYFDFFAMADIDLDHFYSNKQNAIIEKYLAKHLGVKEGDRMVVADGVELICYRIVDYCPFGRNVILHDWSVDELPFNDIHHCRLDYMIKSSSLPKADVVQSLSEQYENEVNSFGFILMQILWFTVFFFGFSFIGTLLTLSIQIWDERRGNAIKHVLGEKRSVYFVKTIVHSVVMNLLAYHVSLVFFFLLRGTMPEHMQVELSPLVYFTTMGVVVVIALLLALTLGLVSIIGSEIKQIRK